MNPYNPPPVIDPREQLQRLFGLDEFRPAQREVIEDVLAGRDVKVPSGLPVSTPPSFLIG